MTAGSTKRGFVQLLSLSLLAYPLAFITQMLTSYYFGTSARMDSYWLAMAVINTLGFFVGPAREGAIPEFYKRLRRGRSEGIEYFSGVGNAILLVAAAALLIAVLAPRQLAHLVAGSNHPLEQEDIQRFIRWLTPLVFFACATEMLNGVLVSYGKVVFQEIGRLLDAVISIACLGLFGATLGIKALIIATVAAPAALFAVQCLQLRALGFGYRPAAAPRVDRNFSHMAGALLIAYAIGQIYTLYERTTFVRFGQGLLSSVQYARTISGVPDQLLTASLTTAIWPSILSHAYENNLHKAFLLTIKACRYLALAMACVILLCFLFSRRIVYLIYFHGAFDPDTGDLHS